MEEENKPKKTIKVKLTTVIIIIIALILLFIGIIAAFYTTFKPKITTNKNNSVAKTDSDRESTIEELTETEKQIVGVDTSTNEETEEIKELQSDIYKEFLELPKEEQEKSEVVPRKEEVPFEKLEEIKEILNKEDHTEEQETDSKTEDKKDNTEEDKKDDTKEDKNDNKDDKNQDDKDELPSRFNLAEEIDIKVENQSSYGLCWSFASLNTVETYLALNNLGNYDFSELHLDYIQSNLMYGNRNIHEGGNFSDFKNYTIVSGVVLEEQVPYNYTTKYDGEEYTNIKDYKEEEYSKFVDMEKIVEVTETIDFPSIYKHPGSEYTDEQIAEFRETVKKHIMKNGSLYTQIISTREKNHYTSSDCSKMIDHAVSIVGWDDNYSKDNFISDSGKKPENDGAYIALNSWGENYNDGGYYYISYEDKYVESALSGVTSTSMESAYNINSIKNKELIDYLKNNYGHLFIKYKGEDYITKNMISNIHSLDLSNKNLSSLNGIEIFTNLNNLDVSNNNITNITQITKLKSLSGLNLSNNKITDISPLGNMKTTYLTTIKLSNNKIKDVSALSNMRNKYGMDFVVDISNNSNVIGYEKLNNTYSLNISNCNVKDVTNLKDIKNLSSLYISNTPGIKGLESLSENIGVLDISNCNINDISILKNKAIGCLNISNNNITKLDGIQDFSNMYELDVSGNPIKDFSVIKQISSINPYFNELNIIANNCNIDNITVFNDSKVALKLTLKDNKIKDISQFRNKRVHYIDLSNNENLTGLETLSNINTVLLNNCNINDISEILKLINVVELSLENNNLSDITELSRLKNIESLSLAGNKQMQGTIASDSVYILNVSDCNLDSNFDFSGISNLSYLNISKNSNISALLETVNTVNYDYGLTLIVDEVDFKDFEELKSRKENENKYLYFENATINLEYNLKIENKQIDLSNNKILKRELMKNIANGLTKIENGRLNKNGYILNINDINKNIIEIKFINNITFQNSTIKITCNENKEEINKKDDIINLSDSQKIELNEGILNFNLDALEDYGVIAINNSDKPDLAYNKNLLDDIGNKFILAWYRFANDESKEQFIERIPTKTKNEPDILHVNLNEFKGYYNSTYLEELNEEELLKSKIGYKFNINNNEIIGLEPVPNMEEKMAYCFKANNVKCGEKTDTYIITADFLLTPIDIPPEQLNFIMPFNLKWDSSLNYAKLEVGIKLNGQEYNITSLTFKER